MRLTSPKLLADYMEDRDFSQARLGRYAGCSRQFIHMLLTGDRHTCTVEIGRRIEEALNVLPGTLFVTAVSPETKQSVKSQKAAAVA